MQPIQLLLSSLITLRRRSLMRACIFVCVLFMPHAFLHPRGYPCKGDSSLKNYKETSAEDVAIRFSYFHTGFGGRRTDFNESLYMTIHKNGEVSAILFDPPSVVTSVYQGALSPKDLTDFLTRARNAIREAANQKADETLIREGDRFSLYTRSEKGEFEEFKGGGAALSDSAQSLIEDLRVLWKRLDKAAPADGYVRGLPMAKGRFESLRREGGIRFRAVGEYPEELQPLIRRAVDCPLDFHPLSRAQLDKPLTHSLAVTHNGSGYEVMPFMSKPDQVSETQPITTGICPNRNLPRYQAASGVQTSEGAIKEIRFDYAPRMREEFLEDVFLKLNADGEASAVLYDYYGSKVVSTYKGKLPKATATRLLERVNGAIREAEKLRRDKGRVVEGDLLSITAKFGSGAIKSISGVAGEFPEATRNLAEDLRVLWKQLDKSPPAPAYLRGSPIEKERLALLLKEGKLRFTRLQDFPPDLQKILRSAVRQPSDFHALHRSQLGEFKRYASSGEVFLTDGDAGYKISFFLPKQDPTRQRNNPAQPEAGVSEIVFSFHPRMREEYMDDMSLSVGSGGEARVVFYDNDRSVVTTAYKGTIPGTDMARLVARVEEAFEAAKKPGPHDNDGLIIESDLFLLSMRRKDGTVNTMGRRVEYVPEVIRRLVEDLSEFWKRLKKTTPADGYVMSRPMSKERFELLRNEIKISPISEMPADVRPILTSAIERPHEFHALSQTQLDKLKSQKSLVVNYGGSGHELHLFASRK